jgi:hypothetical protein
MASPMLENQISNTDLLKEILDSVKALESNQKQLSTAVDKVNERVNTITAIKQVNGVGHGKSHDSSLPSNAANEQQKFQAIEPDTVESTPVAETASPPATSRRSNSASRIILTTYPNQSGVTPLPMNWGHSDSAIRGPVVVSRHPGTIGRRNGNLFQHPKPSHIQTNGIGDVAIGAHGGAYSIYHALAVASNEIKVDHRPDFTNTEPAANVGPFAQWADPKKIVSMDPLGHLAPWLFKDIIAKENVDIRPTIAITRAHMKLPELEQSVKAGRLVPDGQVCLNTTGELAVTKFAVEPVW